ncbi:MAG: hypothetical protein H7Y42_04395 [Chitinophagaceae bacterium]|nr:hypothetical protein [Chitinophagaceae bacterium]
MKRVQLIEWGIIVIGLIFGYKFVESILSLFIQIVYGWGYPDIAADILRVLLISAVYGIALFILLRNSHRLAAYFSQPSGDEHVAIKIGKRSLLQVILIALCLFIILTTVSDLIFYIFDAFRNEVRPRGILDIADGYNPSADKYSFVINFIKILLAIIVIYSSKRISDWLIRRDEADELVFDSTPQN